MSERARARGMVREELLATDEDTRRKLEGRVELLEAGLQRYRWLDDALKGGDWEDLLRAQPALIQEVLERDAACLEAVERVGKRAEVEGWREDAPVLGLACEVTASRAQLETWVRKRLGSVTTVRGALSLEEALRRLESIVRVPVSLVREPGESFSLPCGTLDAWKQNLTAATYLLSLVGIMGLALFALVRWPSLNDLAWLLCPAPFLLTGGAILAFRRLRPGVLWLTPRRLVWAPSRSEPVELRLDSIPEGGIEMKWGSLRVEGGRLMHLRGLGEVPAKKLRLWLELLVRQPELRERTALVEQPVDVVCFPALLRRNKMWEPGQAVLLRRMLFFLPGEDAGATLVRAATGRTLDFHAEPSWVLSLLRWQPESDLDAYLLRAVKASRGVAWPSDLARHSRGVPLEQEIHITYGDDVLAGRAPGRDLPPIARILESWEVSGTFSPPGRGA
ncbi:hypothetical protein [Pyxidicoccus sp. MSG2]|uniref:hypothetical protein n=1 Tax=Pyxidicoccus sp. MSG2 TaxID=2996790 RepID=UPI0022706AA1|nr:hypothetical protein [Pyxidicoccus sp. MSG2]MCY1019943.1 hypothetical protein [Pyxidicoccus sp. MSG2]